MSILKVQIVRAGARLPNKMTAGSAGFDLYAAEYTDIPPARSQPNGNVEIGRALVPIGIKLELPEGTVGRIASRSGLSVQSNIEAGAGWIDSDYRGELLVELKNFSASPFHIKQGDRIAQLVVLPLVDIEVTPVAEVNSTGRNSSGFGSTGV